MISFPVAGVRTVEVNGALFAYLERGQGQSLVFVHGGYSDLRIWLLHLDNFVKWHTLLHFGVRKGSSSNQVAKFA